MYTGCLMSLRDKHTKTVSDLAREVGFSQDRGYWTANLAPRPFLDSWEPPMCSSSAVLQQYQMSTHHPTPVPSIRP